MKTTELAIRVLLYLAIYGNGQPVSPKKIAEEVEGSPTYMKKIATLLVKGNILRAHRGASGGVTLSRSPSEVTLLEILEACQGKVLGDYCQEVQDLEKVCAFHLAMVELHHSITRVLSRWTLADLVERPEALEGISEGVNCRMRRMSGRT